MYDVYVFLLIYDACINHRCYMLNHKTYHVEYVYFFFVRPDVVCSECICFESNEEISRES